jgi:hypothetical protein
LPAIWSVRNLVGFWSEEKLDIAPSTKCSDCPSESV